MSADRRSATSCVPILPPLMGLGTSGSLPQPLCLYTWTIIRSVRITRTFASGSVDVYALHVRPSVVPESSAARSVRGCLPGRSSKCATLFHYFSHSFPQTSHHAFSSGSGAFFTPEIPPSNQTHNDSQHMRCHLGASETLRGFRGPQVDES